MTQVVKSRGRGRRTPARSATRPDLDVTRIDPNGPLAGPGFLARLRTVVPSLGPAHRRVAEYVMANPQQAVLNSVTEVAAATDTSPATVVRLCQRLGLQGFQHLKIALAQDLAPDRDLHISELTRRSTPAEILATVTRVGSEGLASIPATLDLGEFTLAVEAIARASRVVVTGVGSSAAVAQDTAHRLTTVGLNAEAPADDHRQHLLARLLGPGSVLLAISNSGSTRETVESLRAAARRGAVTIAVTGYARSPLADAAEIRLVAGSPHLLVMRTESLASRLVHLAMLDAVIVAVVLARGSRANEALDAVDEVASMHRY